MSKSNTRLRADTDVLRHDNLPNVRPALSLDFANGRRLSDKVNFSRGSVATYFDGSSAKAEENLYRYSNNPTQYSAGWSHGRINTPVQDADGPFGGTNDAWTIVQNDTSGTNGGYLKNVSYSDEDKQYCYSFYIKYVDWPYIRVTSNTIYKYIVFDIQNNTVTDTDDSGITHITNWGITDVGNGWSRIFISGMFVGDEPHIYFNANGTGSTNPVPNGVSYKWFGGQLEKGRSTPTAYTETLNSAVQNYQPCLKLANPNSPRFDHNPVTGESKGLLIEESATNLVPDSIDRAWHYEASSTANFAIAPDGTQSANYTEFNIIGAAVGITSASKPSAPETYCYSVFVKSGGLAGLNAVKIADNQQNISTTFYLDSNTYSISENSSLAGIEDIGNGWKRIWTSGPSSNTDTYFQLYRVNNAENGYNSLFWWGSQMEAGDYPSSYIPTNGSQSTRDDDKATIDIANVDDLFGLNRGTLYAEWNSNNESSGRVLQLDRATPDQISIWAERFYIRNNLAAQVSYTFGVLPGTDQKAAMAFEDNNTIGYMNGTRIITDTNCSIPGDTEVISIGSYSEGSSGYLNGTIKKVSIYNEVLSSDNIKAITEE